MELMNSNKTTELIKSNQEMVLIKLSRDIQSWVMIKYLTECHDSWHLVTCSITKDGMTLNRNSIMSRGSLWSLNQKYNINS